MISVLAYSLILLLGVLYCIPAISFMLVFALFNFYNPLRIRRMMRRIILGLGYVTVKLAIRPFVKVETEYEDAAEKVGTAVYICNHRAASDAFLVSEIRTSQVGFQVMKGWPMRLPFLGLCARVGGYFSIADQPFEKTLEQSRQLLINEKAPVFVYPEGTRSGNRQINQFHGTFFRIAKELELPIVPVAIAGNENIPDLKFKLHCGRIKIRVLKSIPAQQVKEMPLFTLKNLVRNRLIEETRLLDERLDNNEQ